MNRFYSLASGIILIFALNVSAQQTATAPGSADKGVQGQPAMQDDLPSADDQLKILTIKLDLTDDQQAKVKPILQDLHDATVKISQNRSLSRDASSRQVRPLRLKHTTKSSEVLKDEQKKKLEQYMKGPHADMHGNLSGTTASPQAPKN